VEEKITIRFSEMSDEKHLVEWLSEPGILRWFPMCDQREIKDAAAIWMSYTKYQAVLTALYEGKPAAIANLYLQPYKKLAHQCLFAIIAKEEFRGKGVGTKLLEALMKLAKEQFNIEMLHLEVYEGNPAIHLYKRLGFKEYGLQKRFLKEPTGEYLGKIFMQKGL
jgi:putative acetyltransferase